MSTINSDRALSNRSVFVTEDSTNVLPNLSASDTPAILEDIDPEYVVSQLSKTETFGFTRDDSQLSR